MRPRLGDRPSERMRSGPYHATAGPRTCACTDASLASGGVGGCPIGSLASELAERSDRAREILAGSFSQWQMHLAESLERMRTRGELRADANPHELALAIVAALQGGLLLTQTARTARPLKVALDMALDHVSRQSLGA